MFKAPSPISLFVALLIAGVANSQAPIHFDDPNGEWYVAHTYPNGSEENPHFVATSTALYSYSGDTVIEGATWQRLFELKTIGDAEPLLVGYVRQVDQLVLFKEPGFPTDTLYNFGLQVGDAMPFGRAGSYFQDTLIVETIDQITIEGVEHNVFRFSLSTYWQTLESTLSDTWIEGIGSIHGPLAPLHAHPLEDSYPSGPPDSTRLICYTQDGGPLWHHPSYADCVVNIEQSVGEHADAPLSVFPNPARDHVTVEGLPGSSAMLSLTDALGRVVMRRTVHGSTHQVDTRSLHPGPYSIQVETDGQVIQRVRVLVQ